MAWQRLRSKLYELRCKAHGSAAKLEDTKTDVGWGHQIRSYVLDNSRIKDLRTNVEISATQKVLDGDLDAFIEASLKQGRLKKGTSTMMKEGQANPPLSAWTTPRPRSGSTGGSDVRPGPGQDPRLNKMRCAATARAAPSPAPGWARS